MALLGYQDWKADLVESGICRQAIRQHGRHLVKIGDRLLHYRHLNTPHQQRIRGNVQDFCQKTFPIELLLVKDEALWKVNGIVCQDDNPVLLDIATREGFKSVEAMTAWFLSNLKTPTQKGERVFLGDVIRW